MPVDNLRASPFLINYIQTKIPDYRNAVIVARHPGQAKRATAFAERLRLSIAVIHGELEKELEPHLSGYTQNARCQYRPNVLDDSA